MLSLTRNSLLVAGAALTMAAPAAAHTSATCVLDHAQAHCIGTIGGRWVSPAPAPASLSIDAGRAQFALDASPLVAIFSPDLTVNGDLHCGPQAVVLDCRGTGVLATGLRDDEGVYIETWGAPDGSSAMIRLTDGAAPPAPAASPTKQPRHRHHARRHGRRRR